MYSAEAAEDIIHHPTLFGANLRRLRIASDMSVQQAARALGLSKSFLSMVENGQRSMRFEDSMRLVHLYGYSFAWFLTQTRDAFMQSVIDAPLEEQTHKIVQRRSDALLMTGERGTERVPRLLLLRPLRSRTDTEWVELMLPAYTQLTERAITLMGEVRGVIQRGTLLLVLNNDEYIAREGEEFCFDGSIPHVYRNYRAESVQATLVITPAGL
ncbi:MAG: XRE family transcriptional regulator [Bacteroidota bacterium]|nr:XRE family transcriptional regulator [Candidatus Kapabacteria bacterium]MDW8220934.1 XRE family transcriptional regulator [Bacteroidota bacterium]